MFLVLNFGYWNLFGAWNLEIGIFINMSTGVLGDIKQQFGGLGKQLGQAVASAPKTAVKTVASQIGIEVKDKEGKKEIPQQVQNQKPPEIDAASKQANEDFVKGLYEPTPDQKPQQPKEKEPTQQQKAAIEMAKDNPNATPEEIQKMVALRQQLHGEYYQKLTTAQGRPEEAQEKQEREADRMERLGMEDLQEKKKEEEKKKPIAVLMQERKTEAPMGAG